MYILLHYNNTKLQLIYAGLESSPEQSEDPVTVSTEDPILTNDPTLMDADDDKDDKQMDVEPPTSAEIVQAGLQRGDLSDENISVDRRGRRATGTTTCVRWVQLRLWSYPLLQINLC